MALSVLSSRTSRRAATQKGFVKSFNGRMLDELFNETLFSRSARPRRFLPAGIEDYHSERSRSSLGYATPAAFADGLQKATGGVNAVRCFAGAHARDHQPVSDCRRMKSGDPVNGSLEGRVISALQHQ